MGLSSGTDLVFWVRVIFGLKCVGLGSTKIILWESNRVSGQRFFSLLGRSSLGRISCWLQIEFSGSCMVWPDPFRTPVAIHKNAISSIKCIQFKIFWGKIPSSFISCFLLLRIYLFYSVLYFIFEIYFTLKIFSLDWLLFLV